MNQIAVSTQQLEELTKEWAQTIGIDIKGICLSFIEVSCQTGQNYKILINLFLPTIWNQSSVEKIQISLDHVLKKHLNLKIGEILIITSIIQSGNVVENGQLVNWDK